MKFRFFLLFSLMIFSVIAKAPKAKAQEVNYVAAAISALQTSNVYVAPGIPGTSSKTTIELNSYLLQGDNIVLIMLPMEAANNTDLQTIAKKISDGLSNQKTIGLAVGDEVIGYSEILPSGIATSQMIDANSVSNSSSTALSTFARNIQIWLVQHPQPSPTPSPEPTPTPRPTMQPIVLPKVEDVPWTAKAIFLVLIPILTILFINKVIAFNKTNALKTKRQKRLDGLNTLWLLIQKIEINIAKIKNPKVRKDLEGAVKLAYGLIEIFQESDQFMGMTEAQAPSTISDMDKQVMALIRHESGRRPVPPDLLDDLILALLNYDALFTSLQGNDPRGVDLYTSIISTKTNMISRLGYLDDEN
jgi:hypothetical protein